MTKARLVYLLVMASLTVYYLSAFAKLLPVPLGMADGDPGS